MKSLRREMIASQKSALGPLIGIIFTILAVSPASAETLQLRYEAFVGGAQAGSARLALSQTTQGYSIVGSARSKGLMDSLNPWRAQFEAKGTLVDGLPSLEQYHYVESDNRKLREVTVSDGQLRVVKNGKLRAEHKALPGMDILSALFVEPSCEAALELHTGRHGYRLESTAAESSDTAERCRYVAQDDDGDKYRIAIEFVQLGGVRVPRVIEVSGFLSGRMQLKSYELPKAKLAATASSVGP